jgi:hypothetical protein
MGRAFDNGLSYVASSSSSYTIHHRANAMCSASHDLGGWEACLHPEGVLYFYHPQRVGFSFSVIKRRGLRYPHMQKIYTLSYLLDPDELLFCEDFARQVETYRDNLLDQAPELKDATIVLHLDYDDDGETRECYYYLVNHKTRTLFWLTRFNAGTLLRNVDSVTETSHQRCII